MGRTLQAVTHRRINKTNAGIGANCGQVDHGFRVVCRRHDDNRAFGHAMVQQCVDNRAALIVRSDHQNDHITEGRNLGQVGGDLYV